MITHFDLNNVLPELGDAPLPTRANWENALAEVAEHPDAFVGVDMLTAQEVAYGYVAASGMFGWLRIVEAFGIALKARASAAEATAAAERAQQVPWDAAVSARARFGMDQGPDVLPAAVVDGPRAIADLEADHVSFVQWAQMEQRAMPFSSLVTLEEADIRLLSPDTVARLLDVTVGALAHWRKSGLGPRYVSFVSSSSRQTVRYPVSMLVAWLDALPRDDG